MAGNRRIRVVAVFVCAIAMVSAACGGRASSGVQGSPPAARPTLATTTAISGTTTSTLIPLAVGSATPGLAPNDSCSKDLFFAEDVLPTVVTLYAEHGRSTGGGCNHYLPDGTACDRTGSYGLAVCPASPTPRMTAVLYEPGTTADPRPGFLTCVRPGGATESVCGVDVHDFPAEPDLSSAWVFSPYPAGATMLDYPFSNLPTPRADGYDPVDQMMAGGGDPIQCVGTATQQWTFHIASHTYVPGKCPWPWN